MSSNQNETKRSGFTGNLGFILAAAGSAVGLGNLWRFPYVAAKDGGGLFVLLYIIFALTFGFALLVTEIAIGRRTQSSPLTAYTKLNKNFGFMGVLSTLIPFIIFPYYSVIGGWVVKYAFAYVSGGASEISGDAGSYFTGFITSQWSPIICFTIFLVVTAVIVYFGVDKGIEKASKIMMPALFLLIIGIAIYSLTLSHTDEDGTTRTALDGLKIYLIPSFEGLTFGKFMSILLDVAAQMFYSLSIAMGIMIAYGSYSPKQSNIVKSVNQIEFFDTFVALLAGVIIIPSVFVFQGSKGLEKSGPSLMFISLPQVFSEMGIVGIIIGACFFILVLFAALTSSISLMEAIVSSLEDKFHLKRHSATILSFVLALVIGIVVCLGYNIWYFDYTLPNGAVGQILDILDYISNNLLMPIVAFVTCILVGWILKKKVRPSVAIKNTEQVNKMANTETAFSVSDTANDSSEQIADETAQQLTETDSDENEILSEIKIGMDGKFRREGLYKIMVKFVCPIILIMILLQAFNVFGA